MTHAAPDHLQIADPDSSSRPAAPPASADAASRVDGGRRTPAPPTLEMLNASIVFLEAKLGQLARLVDELQADRDRLRRELDVIHARYPYSIEVK